MNRTMKMTTLAVSLLVLAGAVYANPGVKWPSFDEVDKNKDGAIDKNEAKVIKGLDFKTADADGDNKINQVEYRTAQLKAGQEGGTDEGSAPQTYPR